MHTLFCLILLVSILIAILTKLVRIISRKSRSYDSTIRGIFFSPPHRQTCDEIQYLTGATFMIENVARHYTIVSVLEFTWKLEILQFLSRIRKNF